MDIKNYKLKKHMEIQTIGEDLLSLIKYQNEEIEKLKKEVIALKKAGK